MKLKKVLSASSALLGCLAIAALTNKPVYADENSNEVTNANSYQTVKQDNIVKVTQDKTPVWNSYDLSKQPTGQTLSANTSWKSSQYVYNDSNTEKWYNVGTNQWVDGKAVAVNQATNYSQASSKIQTYNSVGTITYNGRGKVAVWSNYDHSKKLTGQYLANGTKWKVFKKASDENGLNWYNLGANQWVTEKYLTFNNSSVAKAAIASKPNPNKNGLVNEGKRYVFYRNGQIQKGTINNGKQTFYTDKFGGIYAVKNQVPVISQLPELPTGCEMTAVAMMLQAAGVNVSKKQVAQETPRANNGDRGFVGNPYSITGWWVFPKGIAPVVNKHLGHSEDMTGASLSRINDKLIHGHAVVMWMGNMNGFVNHAVTLTGYSSGTYYYNNPWTGKAESMKTATLMSHWTKDKKRALSY
ncbi:C39 family peptidase [uncultured Lactobacillus sp.]|uniref:C39 family peptidase n=1 Tax=uncultured Lactobacillus sp. TaxID=153152 RepID=UPI00262185D3|nr:C39 family peptidase [uncultured Lactobacillus sp.]